MASWQVSKPPRLNPSCSLSTAARGFGKFQDSFLGELYADIHTHSRQEETGHVPQPVPGITVHDSDILEPEPAREGGLTQKSKVMVRNYHRCSLARTYLLQRHTFRKPLEPPTPRRSVLGLDRLAKEKRAEREEEESLQRKRPRLGDDPVFKGVSPGSLATSHFDYIISSKFTLAPRPSARRGDTVTSRRTVRHCSAETGRLQTQQGETTRCVLYTVSFSFILISLYRWYHHRC